MEAGGKKQFRVFTIGHSSHTIDRFLALLKQFAVEVLVDTRSLPRSSFAPQFDLQPFREAVKRAGLRYLNLGRQLGGRPEGPEFYDATGHVLYWKVAQSPAFQEGIARLESGMRRFAIALLCAEEDPARCHRRLLVGRVLAERGVSVEHIRGDGRLQSEAELSAADGVRAPQMSLFEEARSPEWKSIPSVSQRRRQNSSSAS